MIITDHIDNIRLAIEKIGMKLSYNAFSQKPLVQYVSGSELNRDKKGPYDGPLSDSVFIHARCKIETDFQMKIGKDRFADILSNEANVNSYHPVLDYLNGLTWDLQPRIDDWLIVSGGAGDTSEMLKEDQGDQDAIDGMIRYTKAVSAIMLMAAVNRVMHPGCKYDEMVVLESRQQGIGKSVSLRTLCPNGDWFSDDLPLNVNSQQIVEATAGKWIIEAAELSQMNPSRMDHLKAMLSRQVDGPVRMAYDRYSTEKARQFIIVGTINSSSYLTDSTGNRRFWPIQVKKFNVKWIEDNRDQLWAEAYARARGYTSLDGKVHRAESIRLNPELYTWAGAQQEKRRVEDPWEVLLENVYSKEGEKKVKREDVWNALGIAPERRNPSDSRRISELMGKLGFKYQTYRDDIFDTQGQLLEGNKVMKGFVRFARGEE